MTKIPTVREQYEEKFGWAGSSGTFTGIRDEEIMKFIISQREAGAREERARILMIATKILSVIDFMTLTVSVEPLTPPTK